MIEIYENNELLVKFNVDSINKNGYIKGNWEITKTGDQIDVYFGPFFWYYVNCKKNETAFLTRISTNLHYFLILFPVFSMGALLMTLLFYLQGNNCFSYIGNYKTPCINDNLAATIMLSVFSVVVFACGFKYLRKLK